MHSKAVDDLSSELVQRLLSPAAQAAVAPHLPSPGIEFLFLEDPDPDIRIHYSRGTGRYSHHENEDDEGALLNSTSTVRSLLSKSVEREARDRVRAAIDKATSVRFTRS